MSRAIAAVQTPGRRRRSEGKKAAILDAAEALFIAEGYERASVDAIAARAQVSKRTVYDHFGDKATIFLKALERVNDALADAVQAAIEEELTPGRDLREALTAFGRRVVTQTVPSSDYVTFRRLTSQHWAVPRLAEAARDRPERTLEERFAALAAGGELTAADPRLAARHFTALTIGLALETLEAGGDVSEAEIVTVIADGVDAFLRAYRTGPA
ncbi:TetR family transcriptional regulator [Nonomuraea fuscirosea]|uniref:TetR family transcriptional regulator n=1 Tax=Nonomuraea fuscirosea TaxID=1291556 RepID=A0A2T0N3T0_9ACTN|nr:TetR/AcrR family transcriptional regulator [Nonomuraea fuscirosea]PRX66790.1 TetR family transcriptional regulator [Nonomuraea fuscirosea]